MNRAVILSAACLGLFVVCGCEAQPPSSKELGRIVYSESDVPGTDKPYALPEHLRKAPPASKPEGRKPGD